MTQMTQIEIPIIDIADINVAECRSKIGQEMFQALKTKGVFYISNHGLGDAVTELFSWSMRFFDLPKNDKDQCSIDTNEWFRGYEYPTENSSKEGFVIGPERQAHEDGRKYHGPNVWPDHMPELKTAMNGFFEQVMMLSRQLHRAFFEGIGQSAESFDRMSRDPNAALRLLHYPTGQNVDGIAEHTDWGGLSLLMSDGREGLEIKGADGLWHTPEMRSDLIMIHPGNLVARFTNDVLKALPHRVVNKGGEARYSIAFFLDMDQDAIIAPLSDFISKERPTRYAPICVADYLEEMHKQDYG